MYVCMYVYICICMCTYICLIMAYRYNVSQSRIEMNSIKSASYKFALICYT